MILVSQERCGWSDAGMWHVCLSLCRGRVCGCTANGQIAGNRTLVANLRGLRRFVACAFGPAISTRGIIGVTEYILRFWKCLVAASIQRIYEK